MNSSPTPPALCGILLNRYCRPCFGEGEVIDRRAGHRYCCEDQDAGDEQQQAAHDDLELR